MSFPFDIQIGLITIPVHPLFEFASFTFGYWYYKYLAKKNPRTPLSPEAEWAIIVGMVIGAFFGSRLIAALEHPALFLHPMSFMYYFASQTVAGGFFGGIIGVEIAKKIIGIKRRTGDFFVYPLILATAIGRIGCFLTGVKDGTSGIPSSVPWAFDQGDGIARHPTAAYEIIFCLLLFAVLRILDAKRTYIKLREGDLFAIFMGSYFLFRLCIEFIKPIDVLVWGLSSIQLVSAIGVIYYFYFFIQRLWSPQK